MTDVVRRLGPWTLHELLGEGGAVLTSGLGQRKIAVVEGGVGASFDEDLVERVEDESCGRRNAATLGPQSQLSACSVQGYVECPVPRVGACGHGAPCQPTEVVVSVRDDPLVSAVGARVAGRAGELVIDLDGSATEVVGGLGRLQPADCQRV